MMTNADQARHTRIVTELMMSACGDLILDKRGNLCYRRMHDADTWADLSWEQHGIGDKLADITRAGWALTADGAQFILENCPPEPGRRGDRRFLEALARGR